MFKFTEKDKENIKLAVTNLEKDSSVELVPYFVEKSDDYKDAIYKIPVVSFFLMSILFILLQMNWMLPKEFTVSVVLSILLIVNFSTLILLFFIPKIRILLIDKSTKKEACLNRARQAFLEEELFNTKSRVGVLIFVSYLEKEVIVLGDKGINKKFESSDWEKLVKDLIDGIKKDKVAEGVIEAINHCKKMVLDKQFIIEKDDKNELNDDLRIGD